MTMEYKSFAPQVKAVSSGVATVVIATLGVVDKDGDVILPGFFGEQVASLKPAHDWQHYDIGKAWIKEIGNEAIAELRFNLKTDGGKNWHEAILFDYENQPAIQEYSFGFRPFEGSAKPGNIDGKNVRLLGPLSNGGPGGDVAEVSPVTRGAGQRTRTLAVKEEQQPQQPEPEPPKTDAPTDVKNLNISQLLSLLVSQIDHLSFIQSMRKERGRDLSAETVAMIDDVSTRFGELRAKVHLGNGEPDPLCAELEKSLARVQESINRDQEEAKEKKRAEDASLEREVMARLERVSAILHP